MEYVWILIVKSNGIVCNYSRALDRPKCHDEIKFEWIKWGKPLPDDIDSVVYKYENGELKAV